MKVIKFDGLFGQYGFKGQAILFAQDIFEVSEKLPNMLPRSAEDAGIIIITEHLENLNTIREFSIDRKRVYDALRWLITNNPLYTDVIIDHTIDLNDQALVRVTGPIDDSEIRNEHQANYYVPINNISGILRASWHQANLDVFNPMCAGIQCCAMVLANILRASLIPPGSWTKNILDRNMLEGDNIYMMVRTLSEQQEDAYPIENGYLLVRNFDVIKQDFTAFDKSFSIDYDNESNLYGSLNDALNTEDFGVTLHNALTTLFQHHVAGILISAGKSFGVMYYEHQYYFMDSRAVLAQGLERSTPNLGVVGSNPGPGNFFFSFFRKN